MFVITLWTKTPTFSTCDSKVSVSAHTDIRINVHVNAGSIVFTG